MATILKVRYIGILVFVSLSFSSVFAKDKRALLIGISTYPIVENNKDASWSSIHGANDINIITPQLKKQGFRITSLIEKNATANNIRKALVRLEKECKQGDLVYIHFSMHGQPVEDTSRDESDGWDEALVPYDAYKKPIVGKYVGQNHILDDELYSSLLSIRRKIGKEGFVYIVVDACHAGEFQRSEDEYDDAEIYVRGTDSGFSMTNKKFVPRINASSSFKIKQENGHAEICFIEACRSYQTNCEIKQNNAYYGPLSYYISQLLSTTTLTEDRKWLEILDKNMRADKRLSRQNMVIETSIK